MMLEQILKDRLGVELVDTTYDGRLAVDKSENVNYDLIIMDLNMPIMDGFEAT